MRFEQLEARELLAVQSLTTLNNFSITGNVGEKPESKVWKHGGKWWGVFSDTVGTHVWRLDGLNWTKTLQLSADTSVHVDVKQDRNLAHIVYEMNENSKLASIEFVPGAVPTYQMWSQRPALAPVALSQYVESATIDIDSTGRMWVAYQDQISEVISSQPSTILVKYSDAPYDTWSAPITLASGVFYDDVSAVIAMPGGKIGVMWSDQERDQFGFRTHVDGTDPTVWTADETPAKQFQEPKNFADDHINLAIASDGTLFAAVKTSYDTAGKPWIGFLVRHPNGVWDDLYPMRFDLGTRPAIQLNETTQTFIYSYDDDLDWVYHECSMVTYACGPANIMLTTGKNGTSTKQNVSKDLVVLTSGKSTGGSVSGSLFRFDVPNLTPVVDAGPNQNIFAAQAAKLDGYVVDDGLPEPPDAVTTTWSKITGPGTVTFGNASSPITTATFSAEGAYNLRLTASDGTLTAFDDITIIVGEDPVNQAPTADAGPDQAIGIAETPLLDGTVIDDGLPFVPGAVTSQWSKVSGPGTVTFGTPAAADTTVSFNATGTYTLRLTAFDGEFTAADDVVVTVTLLPPNKPPVVNAGSDQTILIGGNATLNGSFTDDGQPIPSSQITTLWSKTSGPGVVSFLNASQMNTAANFSDPGTYVLQLAANDTEYIGVDTLTVTVLATPPSETKSFQDGVSPTPAYAGTRDTKLRSDNATTIYGTNNKLEVDGSPDFTSLMKWDISEIPTDAVVTGASFTINVVNTTTATFQIYEVVRDWIETQANFNVSATGVNWGTAGAQSATDRGNTVLGSLTAPSLGLVTVNLNAAGLAVIQTWVSNPTSNNGLIIQNYLDSATDDIDFNAREISTPTTRPKLNVSYSTVLINDPPFIGSLAGDTLAYLENAGPLVIDQGTPALVTDADSPDFAFGTFRVSVASGAAPAEDVLSIRSAGDISFDGSNVRYLGNVIGTATGGVNGTDLVVPLNVAATPAALTALVRAITYANVSENPSVTPRTVTFTIIDGDGTTNGGVDTVTVSTTITLTAVNDPPAIININDDELLYTENSGLVVLDVDETAQVVALDSPDFDGGSLVVSLGATAVAGQDTLAVKPGGPISLSGANVLFNGTPFAIVSGGTSGTDLVFGFNSAATVPTVTALVTSLAYSNSSDAPTPLARAVSLTINDGDGTANGGTDTATRSMFIEIQPVNDPPVVSNLSGDLLSYVEGTGLQVLDQATASSMTDPDSPNMDGGSLTVSVIAGGVPAQDVLSVKHAGSAAGQIGFAGSTVSFEGTAIGTVTGGQSGSALVIQLNSSATVAAVSALLRAISYDNTSDTPTVGQRTVSVVLVDGDGTLEGGVDTATATTTIGVSANNDPPVMSNLNGDTLVYTESTGAQLFDQAPSAAIADLDSVDFDAGSVVVSVISGGELSQDALTVKDTANITWDGANVRYQGTVMGTSVGGTGGANLVITLNSAATPASITSLLQALAYTNTSVAPTASNRTITVAVSDGDGTANGGADLAVATVTVTIAAINAPPVVGDWNGDALNYIEDASPQRLDQGATATVSDVDSANFDGGSLTVSITAGGVGAEDILSVLSAGDITVSGANVSYQGSVVGTLSGGSDGAALEFAFNSNATPAAVAALLHAIAYSNTSNTPTLSPRQVTVTLVDGDGTLNSGADTSVTTLSISITPTNDAPGLSHLQGDQLAYPENGGALVIDQGTLSLVSDVDSSDFASGSLSVTILTGGVSAQDILSIQNNGGLILDGATVRYLGTAIGTAAGGTNGASLVVDLNSAATPTSVAALTQSVTYANSSDAPTAGARVVVFTLNDGDGTANGGTDAGSATTTVSITAVNDVPLFSGLNGGNSFNEGGSAVVVDPDVTVSDSELDAANNFAGSSLTIARQGGANVDDIFSIHVNGTPAFTVGAVTLEVSGTPFATFTNSAGTLQIQFLSGSTSVLVNDVLQRIVYANAAAVLPASVTLNYTLNDGNAADAQGAGANPGIGAAATVVLVNRLPALVDLNGGATYTEDGVAVQVDSDAVVTDPELDVLNNYAGASITVTRQGGSQAEDVISVNSATATLAGSNVMVGGLPVAIITQGPGSTLALTFTSNATAAIADDVLRAITYAATSQNPATGVTLAYTFHDGTAQVPGSASVLIVPVNDPPAISQLNGDTLTYIENAGAVPLDQSPAAAVVPMDSADFDNGSLTVSISSGGVPAEDGLGIGAIGNITLDGTTVRFQGNAFGSFTGGSSLTPLEINFTSGASPAAVSALLNAVTYSNTSDLPATAQRQVTFTLNDGDGTANGGADTSAVTVTVEMTPVNDPPALGDLEGDILQYTENSGVHGIDQGTVASASDLDSATFDGGSVTVSILSGGVAAEDELSIRVTAEVDLVGSTVRYLTNPIGTVAGGSNGSSLVVSLNSAADAAAVAAVMNAVGYSNLSEAPSTSNRVVVFSLIDGDGVANGGADTGAATLTIQINALNDAPTLANLNGGSTFNEDGSPVVVDPDATINDFELAAANNFSGASLFVSRQGGPNTDDQFGFNMAGTPGFTVGATVLKVGGSTFANLIPGAGLLIIQFANGSTTALVNEVLQRITYNNVGAVLPTSVNLAFTFSDGNSGNAQGAGDNPASANGTAAVAINRLPVFTDLNGGETFMEDGPAVVVDPNADVSDFELDTQDSYAGATLTVARQGGPQPEDQVSVGSATVLLNGSNVESGGQVVAAITQGPGSTLSLTFTSNATATLAADVLRAVTYANTNQNPPASVNLSYTFHDGLAQVQGAVSVNITAVNDAPTIDHLSTLEYLENSGSQMIDQGDPATVADIDSLDFGSGGLTVEITSGIVGTQDVLSIVPSGPISFDGLNVSHLGTPIGTASGGAGGTPLQVTFNNAATPTAVAALLNKIAYTNTSDVPSTVQRLITFTLIDGDGTVNGGTDTFLSTATVNITAVNDAPVLSNLQGDSVAYVENDGAVVIDQPLAALVSDVDSPDFDGGTLTVTVASGGVVAQDVLSISTVGNIGYSAGVVSHSGTPIGTVLGGSGGVPLAISLNSSASAAALSQLIQAISYSNVSDTPTTTSRVITFELNDGDGTANGGNATGTVSTTISLTAVNDPPVFIGLDGGSYFNEGGNPVVIDADATVFDAELTALNDFGGAAITIVRSSGQNIDDVFGIDLSGSPSFTKVGNDLKVGGLDFANMTSALGLFLVRFTSAQTPATGALVNEVLQRITYSNRSTTLPTSVQLFMSLSDGNQGDQGIGDEPGTDFETPTVFINKLPVLANLNGGETFVENGPGVLVDTDVVVSDVELDTLDNYDSASLTVHRQGGASPNDVLSLNSPTVSLAGTDVIVGFTVVGTLAQGPGSTLVVDFNSNATAAIADQVLQAVTYANINNSPSSSVVLRYAFSDGVVSTVGSATVSITAVNDAPTIANLTGDELNYIVLTAIGNAPPQVIDEVPLATISDPDSLNFDSGQVSVSITAGGVPAEDVLSIKNTGTGPGEISFDGSNVRFQGVLIGTASGGAGGTPLSILLNAAAVPTSVAALLSAITYANTAAIPDLGQRTVTFSFIDGDGTALGGSDTATATATITLRPINDPPVIGNLEGDVLVIDENASPQRLDVGAPATVLDADSPNFGGGFLSVEITMGGVSTEDVLSVSDHGSITFVSPDVFHSGVAVALVTGGTGGTPLRIDFNTLATEGIVAEVLASISYSNSSEAPNTAGRQVVFTLNDGDGTTFGGINTASVTTSITVVPHNDPPVLSNVDGNGLVNSGAMPILIDGDATMMDIELDAANNYAGASITITRDREENPDDSFGFMAAPNFTVDGSNLKSGGATFATFTNLDGILTVQFTSSETPATTALVNEVLQHIYYQNISPVLPNSVQLSVTISDGNSGNAQGTGLNPGTATDTVLILLNFPPVLINLDGGATFVEDGAPVVVDTNALVADVELDSANLYNGASLTVSIQGGVSGQDVVSLGSALVSLSGANVQIAGVTVATVTQGPGTTLSVLFNNNSTSLAADRVLRAINVSTTDQDPAGNLVLNYQFSDGGGAASQDVTVPVTGVNDAPLVSQTSTLDYTENSGPQRIDHTHSATVSDIDSPDFAGGSLTTSITVGGVAGQDVLSIHHAGTGSGQIGVTGSDVSYEGTVIGNATGGSSGQPLVVQLNGSANPISVAALLSSIQYENTSDAPSTIQRIVTFALQDGDGIVNGGADTGSTTAAINMLPANDAPSIQNLDGDTLPFTENAGAQSIDQGTLALAGDIDSSDFAGGSLTVSFTAGGNPAEDVLSIRAVGGIGLVGADVTYLGTTIGSVGGGSGGANLVVTLNASATLTAVSALLQAVSYNNISNTPSTNPRNVLFSLNDGDGADIGTATAMVEFTAVNDEPVVGNLNGDIVPYTENAAAVAIDAGAAASVQDFDSSDFAGGSLTVAVTVGGSVAGDVLEILSTGNISLNGSDVQHLGNTLGTLTLGGNGTDLLISLTSFATPATVGELLRAIHYRNTSQSPGSEKQISLTLVDGDGTDNGGDDTAIVTVTVQITAVNDPPTILNLDGDSRTYLENSGEQIIDQGTLASVTDSDSVDFGSGTLTVSIATGGVAANDVLSVRTGGTIAVVGSNIQYLGTVIGSVSGGTAGANLIVNLNGMASQAAVSDLLRAVTFTNTSEAPQSTTRTVTLRLNDGDGTANGGAPESFVTTTIQVTAINDAPVLTNLNGDTLSYLEGAGALRVDQGATATVTDVDSPDFGAGSVTASIITGGVSTQDVLSVLSGGDITVSGGTVQYLGTSIGSVSGGASGAPLAVTLTTNATPAAVSALLHAIAYSNSSIAPDVQQRVVAVTVIDGDGTANGGANTASATTTINLLAVNSAPIIGNLEGDTLSYQENAGLQPIDQATAPTVSDVDSVNFDLGTVTVSILAGGVGAEDRLSIQHTGSGAGQIGFDGSAVSFEGTVIGTATGGTAGTDLVVTLNASATQAATAALLRALAYENVSENPTTTSRTVTVKLKDGDGTANGGADQATVTATINITATNDPPVIIDLNGDSFSYDENSGPVPIDRGDPAAVLPLDSPDFDTGSLTVTIITGGVSTEDILSVGNIGDISLVAADVKFLGSTIGTVSGGASGTALAIALNSSATPTAVSALLRAVSYENTSSTPNPASRQVTFTLVDGDGTANGGSDVSEVTATVNLLPINAPPILSDLDGDTLNFSENAGVQTIDQPTAVSVSDIDSADFDGGSLTVAITSGGVAAQDTIAIQPGGQLSISGGNVIYLGNTIGTVTGGANGAALVVQLNSFSSALAMTALIGSITFANPSEAPGTTPRIVVFTLNDGDGTANGGDDTGTATATIQVTAVNDLPQLTGVDGGSTFTEGGSAVIIDSNATASDVELGIVGDYAGATLSISRQGGVNVDDVFTFNLGGTPSFSVGAGVLQAGGNTFASFSSVAGQISVQFVTGSTSALANEVLQRIAYSNVGSVLPLNVPLTVTFTDGNQGNAQGTGDNPGIATGTAIVAINHHPVLADLDGGVAHLEGGPAVQVDLDAGVVDVELDTLDSYAGATLTITRQGGTSADDVISLGSASVSLSGTDVIVGGNTVATLSQAPGSSLTVNFTALATSAIADQILQAVTYMNVNPTPPPSVVLAYSFNDGLLPATGAATVSITAVNDAPLITNFAADVLNYPEGALPTALDQAPAATVQDDSLDFAGGSLTAAFGTGGVPLEDILSVRAGGDITVDGTNVRHLGTIIGTVSGGSAGTPLLVNLNAAATPLTVSALLRAIAYSNSSDLPTTAAREVVVTLVDGDGIANFGSDTAVATVTVQVTPLNDPPVIGNLTGDTVAATEGGVALVINQGAAATVIDPDSLDFDSGSLTVSVSSGGVATQDALSVQNVGDISVSGTDVSYLGTQIGTVAGGTGGTPLVVTLNASATPAAAAALINAIAYQNVSEAPATPRVVVFSLKDGDGIVNGGIDMGSATATVNVTPINDPPTISNLGGDILAYVEATGFKVIDQGTAAAIADIDSLDFGTGTLTVAITANGVAAQDVLSVQPVGGITVSGSNVSHSGTVIGTVAGGTSGANLVVTFNASATQAAATALLRAVSYQNTSTTPSVNPRTVSFTLVDGDGTANGGLDSASVTTTITVTAVDAPDQISFQTGVFPTTGYTGTQDTKVREDNATGSFGTSNSLEMDGKPNITSFIKWDISAIPAGSAVQSASITINVINTSLHTFNLYQMLRSWSEASASYNLAQTGVPWEVAGAQGATDRGSTALATVTSPSLGSVTINLNAAGVATVQSWVNNPSQNFGLVFQNFDDAATDDLDFSSANNTNALLRPKLTVAYVPSGTSLPNTFNGPLRNSTNPFDVNSDQFVTPLDALIVINRLNTAEGEEGTGRRFYPDVTGDGVVAPLDVLLVINFLNKLQVVDPNDNQEGEGGAEGEGLLLQSEVSGTSGAHLSAESAAGSLSTLPLSAPTTQSGIVLATSFVNDGSEDLHNVQLAGQSQRVAADVEEEVGYRLASILGDREMVADTVLSDVEEEVEALDALSELDHLATIGDRESVFAEWPSHRSEDDNRLE